MAVHEKMESPCFFFENQRFCINFYLIFTMLNYIKTKVYEKNITDSFKQSVVS